MKKRCLLCTDMCCFSSPVPARAPQCAAQSRCTVELHCHYHQKAPPHVPFQGRWFSSTIHHWVALLSVYCFNMCTGIKLFYQALQPCQLESSATDLKIVCYRLLACITHKRFFCKVLSIEGTLLPNLSSVNSIILVTTQVKSTKVRL